MNMHRNTGTQVEWDIMVTRDEVVVNVERKSYKYTLNEMQFQKKARMKAET